MPGQLLKQHPALPPPDMSPFFLRQYVKGHANDVFEDYPQLLTEMMLRLPYQAGLGYHLHPYLLYTHVSINMCTV